MSHHVDFVPDGNLVMEWSVMELLARRITDTGMDSFFCHEHFHKFQCLDVGAFSTLSNTHIRKNTDLDAVADVEYVYQTFNITNQTNLFGQSQPCRSKIVGDGMLGVFDLAVLLAYIFKDDGYDHLSTDASTVTTVQGRDGLGAMCGQKLSAIDYLMQAAEQCYLMEELNSPPPLAPPSLPSLRSPSSPPSPPFPPPLSRRTWNYDIWMKHTLLPEGTWYTINLGIISLRTYIVLDTKVTGRLSNEAFRQFSPPQYNSETPQIMFTRRSETTLLGSLRQSTRVRSRPAPDCSTITTPYSDMNAMYKGEIQLMQDEIQRACRYYSHIWIPFQTYSDMTSSQNTSEEVPLLSILYMQISDGHAGYKSDDVISSEALSVVAATPTPPPPAPPLPPLILFECYTNSSGTPVLLSYKNDNAQLGLSDVLTLMYRNVTNQRIDPPSLWDIDMMNHCGDWNGDASIDLSDLLEILYYMLGARSILHSSLFVNRQRLLSAWTQVRAAH